MVIDITTINSEKGKFISTWLFKDGVSSVLKMIIHFKNCRRRMRILFFNYFEHFFFLNYCIDLPKILVTFPWKGITEH